MSRIGRQPVPIPAGVKVDIDGREIKVSGPQGQLQWQTPPEIRLHIDDGHLVVTRPSDQPQHRALHGLTRALIANMVQGVATGFTKGLELRGTGYRAQLEGNRLTLALGYSHPIHVTAPPGITFELEGTTRIRVKGISKEQVGQVAANIRRLRPPEPYLGKGVLYEGEVIRRKAGKAGRGGKGGRR